MTLIDACKINWQILSLVLCASAYFHLQILLALNRSTARNILYDFVVQHSFIHVCWSKPNWLSLLLLFGGKVHLWLPLHAVTHTFSSFILLPSLTFEKSSWIHWSAKRSLLNSMEQIIDFLRPLLLCAFRMCVCAQNAFATFTLWISFQQLTFWGQLNSSVYKSNNSQ